MPRTAKLAFALITVVVLALMLVGCNAHIGYQKGSTDENGVQNTKNIRFIAAYCVNGQDNGGDKKLYVLFDVNADEKENMVLPTDSTSQKLGNVILETSNGNKYYDRSGKGEDYFLNLGYENTLGGDKLSGGSGKSIHYCSVFTGVAPADAKDGVNYEYKISYSPLAQKMTIPFSAVKQASSYDEIAASIPNMK